MCPEWVLFSQSHSVELFSASYLVVECLKPLAPLLWRLELVRVDFSVELPDTPALAKRRIGPVASSNLVEIIAC
jgi:hypothetical protein